MAVPYPSYRQSGRNELGQVPSHWKVTTLRRYIFVKSGDMISTAEIEEDGYPVFGGNGFRGHYHTWNTEPGTLIIGRYGALCGNVRITRQRTMATEHAFRAIPQLPFNNRYFCYLIEHIDLNKFSARSAQPGLNSELVRSNPCAIPPQDEQVTIANFLDHETTRIDALIDKKRRLLDLLEEKRLAVITHAVTKGLDPNVPMKDSGIDWLGEVPAHWTVHKIKYAVQRVVDCLHTTPHYEGDLIYPAIRTADVDRGRLLLEQARLVSEEVYLERIVRLRPEPGDVLYSREGERFGMGAMTQLG